MECLNIFFEKLKRIIYVYNSVDNYIGVQSRVIKLLRIVVSLRPATLVTIDPSSQLFVELLIFSSNASFRKHLCVFKTGGSHRDTKVAEQARNGKMTMIEPQANYRGNNRTAEVNRHCIVIL